MRRGLFLALGQPLVRIPVDMDLGAGAFAAARPEDDLAMIGADLQSACGIAVQTLEARAFFAVLL